MNKIIGLLVMVFMFLPWRLIVAIVAAVLFVNINGTELYGWQAGLAHGLFFLPNLVRHLFDGDVLFKATNCTTGYLVAWWIAIVNGSSFMIWLSVCLLLVYKNACDFCTLILYPETLLKLLISLRRFWAETMGFSKYTIMSSANRDNLTSSFPN